MQEDVVVHIPWIQFEMEDLHVCSSAVVRFPRERPRLPMVGAGCWVVLMHHQRHPHLQGPQCLIVALRCRASLWLVPNLRHTRVVRDLGRSLAPEIEIPDVSFTPQMRPAPCSLALGL